METTLKDIFKAYPDVNEVYQDLNNIVWLNKSTAKQQSQGGQFITITRLEVMGYIVFTVEPKDGETEEFPPIKKKSISKRKKTE